MRLFTNSNEVDTSLGVVERTAYGLGNFANAFMFIAIMTYLNFYYTDVIGLNAGVIGTIMLASRLFDGVTDLIMGYIIDHSRQTKLGKARSWLLKSCIPFAISGVIVFMVPQNASDSFKYIFVFLSYNVCNAIFYTAVSVSYNTLMVKMTRNTIERGLLGIFLMVFSTCSGLIVTGSCLSLVNVFGGGASAWTMTIGVYAVLGLLAHFACVLGTKERIRDEAENETKQTVKDSNTPGFAESIKYLLKNRYWVTYALAWSIYWLGYTLMGSGHIYYAQYILGDQGYQPAMANTIQVVTLIAMLVAFIPMKYLGKTNSARAGAACAAVGYALQIIFAANFTGILVCCALKGFGYGLFCSILGGMNPDTLDYGEWKFGKNVTGMGVAAVSFGQKVGSGFGGAIFGLVLNWGHYDGLAEVQAASALRAIQLDYTYLPLICASVSLILMMTYDLDKKLPEIQAALRERKR